MKEPTAREGWVDTLRIVACFLVILVHADANLAFQPKTRDDAFWGDLLGTLGRISVPLFFMLSGALLLPLREAPRAFLVRRLPRLLWPLVVWTLVYILVSYRSQGFPSIPDMFFRLPSGGEHLWFLYSMVGMTLFLPVLSPWLSSVTWRAEGGFLAVWAVTLSFPYVRLVFPQFWGEAGWNPFGALLPFCGYVGYFILGHWLMRGDLPKALRSHWVLIPSLAVGLAVTWLGKQFSQLWGSDGAVGTVWSFASLNVAIAAAALFLLFRGKNFRSGWALRMGAGLAECSFGIYLIHYLFVFRIAHYWDLAGLAPPWSVLGTTVVTFVVSFVAVRLLSLLPIRRFLVG